MQRVCFVQHSGVPILRCDLSGIQSLEQLAAVLAEVRDVIHRQPSESVLVLAILRDLAYSLEAVNLLRAAAIENRAYVRARAVVGIAGLARLSFPAVAAATRRPIRAFDDERDACDWLLEHA